jgi:hypothetical protein
LEEAEKMSLPCASPAEDKLMVSSLAPDWEIGLHEYFNELGRIQLALGALVYLGDRFCEFGLV